MSQGARKKMDYQEALAELKRALAFGIHPSLEGIGHLVSELGHPETTFVPIQVTGTNGKTSTTRLIDALLRASGQKSGLYTSPELIDYTERIEIEGKRIAPEEFARLFWHVCDARERVETSGEYSGVQITEFELLTALALVAFAEHQLDFGVLEVGLGGRWDATSVVSPAVAVITGVGLDHTHILGDTIPQIAADKAMIIKPGSTPVLGAGLSEALPVILQRCEAVGSHPRIVCRGEEVSPLIEERTTRIYLHETLPNPDTLLVTRFSVKTPHALYENLELRGPAYQAENAATALTAVEAALGRPLHRDDIARALQSISFPARFEVIRKEPLLLFDGGHNPQAAGLLAENLKLAQCRPVVALGVFADKDYERIIEALAPIARDFIALEIDHPRALDVNVLAETIESFTKKPVLALLKEPTISDIVEITQNQPVLITGSLSLYVLLKSYITDIC